MSISIQLRCVGILCITMAATASGQLLHRTGRMPGATHSYANGVSSDGSAVAGSMKGAFEADWAGSRAFRWTVSGGMQTLGLQTPTDLYSQGSGISGDGTIVAANSGPRAYAEYPRGCRFTFANGFVDLGLPPGGGYQFNNGISNDGTTIFGRAEFAGGLARPMLWRAETGFQNLGVPANMQYGTVTGVSANGTVAVGSVQSLVMSRGFRWTSEGGMVLLPYLPGGGLNYWAAGVSADGMITVGTSQTTSNRRHAWRHVTLPQGGYVLTDLGAMSVNQETYATATSADGQVVVGETSDGQSFVWTELSGMRPLKPWLTQVGFNTAPWTDLRKVAAISLDGSSIVGSGSIEGHDEGYVARGVPCFDPPQFLALPASLGLCEGGTINFYMPAGGANSGTITYQWYRNGLPVHDGSTAWGSTIIGSGSSVLTVAAARFEDSGLYHVRASNACGSVENNPQYLQVKYRPRVVTQPVESTFCQSTSGSLSVGMDVHGSDTVGFRWHRWVFSGQVWLWIPLYDGPQPGGFTLSGTDTPTITFGTPQPAAEAFYLCEISGNCGQARSNPAYVHVVNEIPEFATHPSDATTCSHGPVTFSASLTQAFIGPVVYEWQREVSPWNWERILDGSTSGWGGCGTVSGTNTDTITIAGNPNLSASDGVRVRCVVTNACASVLGEPAQLTVCPSDYNCDGGADGSDVDAFFADWENGLPQADLNCDGGVDNDDVSVFFAHWENGC